MTLVEAQKVYAVFVWTVLGRVAPATTAGEAVVRKVLNQHAPDTMYRGRPCCGVCWDRGEDHPDYLWCPEVEFWAKAAGVDLPELEGRGDGHSDRRG